MFPGRVGDAATVELGLPSLLEQMEAAEIDTPRRQWASVARNAASLGADLSGTPDLALSLEWSAMIARWYWTVNRRCNPMADALKMGKVNAAIGYPIGDGAEDRRRCESFKNALLHLTGSVPDGISCAR